MSTSLALWPYGLPARLASPILLAISSSRCSRQRPQCCLRHAAASAPHPNPLLTPPPLARSLSSLSAGANMPCEDKAVKTFEKAKVTFGPAKAANAGGVAVSGLEMVQNRVGLQWSREEVGGMPRC